MWVNDNRATFERMAISGLLTTWDELVARVTRHPSPATQRPDASLNTLRYLFFHTRCGVWVRVRSNAVTDFVPFANAAYRNTYGDRIVLTEYDLSVDAYAAYKAAALHRPPERLLPDKHAWWLNGGIVCNVMPENVWGTEYLAAVHDMLVQTCARHVVPDLDFFINKRDYPQLAKAPLRDVYEPFTGVADLVREAYTYHAPVFSFYTGRDVADRPMPPTEDWDHATGTRRVHVYDGDTGAGDCRDPRAVFRGSATGRGVTAATNVRLRLARFGEARPDLIDAGVTAYNTRDKIVSATSARIVVDFYRNTGDVPTVPRMSMPEQFARFRYVLYADGHCAASRFGVLLHSGCVVLRVVSEHADTCGHLWLFDACVGAATPIALPTDADHCLVASDLSNLEATIVYLRTNPGVAAALIHNARARAPTVDSITRYWAAALQNAEAAGVDPLPGTGVEWYPARDRRYARLGRPPGAFPGVRTVSCVDAP